MAGERAQTVVPTQALFLLNNELVRERAAALAMLLWGQVMSDEERIEQLWLRVFSRPVSAEESTEALAFVQQLQAMDQSSVDQAQVAWVELCHALLCSNEFLHRL